MEENGAENFDGVTAAQPAASALESEPKRSKKGRENKEQQEEPLPEHDPNLWSISKVVLYKPDREKTRIQQFAAENSDTVKILDMCTVENSGGYRCARSAFGLAEGASYFEFTVPQQGNVRAGWSTDRGDPGASVGYDRWQYGIRASDGAVFHNSRRHQYGEESVAGDVIGCYIVLTPPPQDGSEQHKPPLDPEKPLPDIVEEKETCWMVRVSPGTSYSLPSSEVLPVPRRGSKILFFKNGKCLGVAFEDITGGTYYAAVSPFKCKVSVNWGPTFKCPPEMPPGFPEPTPASGL